MGAGGRRTVTPRPQHEEGMERGTHQATRTRTNRNTAAPQPGQHQAPETGHLDNQHGRGLRDASLGTLKNHTSRARFPRP